MGGGEGTWGVGGGERDPGVQAHLLLGQVVSNGVEDLVEKLEPGQVAGGGGRVRRSPYLALG